jgi:hypothetical protein
LLFFTASKPFTFWLNCGVKQNLNDSTYVTQNYWALQFLFKDNPHEEVYFWYEQISISTRVSWKDTFTFSPI